MTPNLTYTLAEFGASFGISTAVASNVNADALLTALITFGVSLVTLAGGELIKFLVAYFNKKTNDLKKDDDKKEGKDDGEVH